jgi:hypothetical protein
MEDVVRKILIVLPIDKYGHTGAVLHQMNLSIGTPTQILGKINAHEMYMHINDKDGSSSKRKDLALKSNQENKGKAKMQIEEEFSSDDDLDANIALMVRKTTKMLKNSIDKASSLTQERRSSSPAKESPSLRWTAIIVENSVILLINATSPRRTSSRARKMDSDDEKKEKKFFKRKDVKHKRFHKKKNGKAYIVGDWLTYIESSSGSSSSEEENNEKVAAIAGDFSSPPSSPSSTSHLCLMAKGEQKVQIENDIIDDSDSDDEFASPSYDELADLLKKYTQIIRKSMAKCDKLKDENEFLTAKYDIVVKASDEMKEDNKNYVIHCK